MAQTLLTLSGLISNSVVKIDEIYKAKGAIYPSLDEPFCSAASEDIRADPDVRRAVSVLAAAAEQLFATVCEPGAAVLHAALGFHVSSAIRVATTCSVAEVLREAGPKGAHVEEITKGIPHAQHVDPQKLARILRLLATKHIFREVSPDVFCNNRLSSMLDTGKPVAELRMDPTKKYQGTTGLVALIEHVTDEGFKSSGYLTEALTHSGSARAPDGHGDQPADSEETALQLFLGSKMGFWEWMELPENHGKLQRFSAGMAAVKVAAPPSAMLQAFQWGTLPAGAMVVDVGGGVGSASLVLAKEFPHLRVVVQDRAKTIEGDAHQFWNDHMPEAVSSGRVELEAHDFFEKQPRTTADVFLLRCVLHDWSDARSLQILQRLREAARAKTDTTLIVIEGLVPYACRPSPSSSGISAAQMSPLEIAGAEPGPEPLLANMGIVHANEYLSDLQMMLWDSGAQERTLPHFERLLRDAGWKIVRVHQTPGQVTHIIAKPA